MSAELTQDETDYWMLLPMVVAVERAMGEKLAAKRRKNPTMDAMRELLATEEAAALYRQRKVIVEPVFGQIKQQRGIREFRLRGIKKTKAERRSFA
ncbi:MAG: transposase [Bryobacterales bacterium]|nr:transposase [Bryobacterales bacterium]